MFAENELKEGGYSKIAKIEIRQRPLEKSARIPYDTQIYMIYVKMETLSYGSAGIKDSNLRPWWRRNRKNRLRMVYLFPYENSNMWNGWIFTVKPVSAGIMLTVKNFTATLSDSRYQTGIYPKKMSRTG